MSADLGAFLHDHHGGLRRPLLEMDRSGQARRPGANDHDVELHRLTAGHLIGHGALATFRCTSTNSIT
jgi:hypothetical protein